MPRNRIPGSGLDNEGQRCEEVSMTFLVQAAIFLVTAVIVVPLFRRLKLGAVLGYLAAGAIIGPWGLGVVPHAEATLDFAELGVVLLLFLVGLELEPSRLWALRQPVFGLGGAQVLVTGLVLAGAAQWQGMNWQAATVAGFGFAMSSTAIVLAWLGERGELSSPSGRRTFAILLFQDLAVIPLIALLPLLAPEKTGGANAWMLAGKGVAAIVLVIVVSRVLVRPLLKVVARFGGREIFTGAALLVVIAAALLMESLGLSMSLGAFLAGVLLADSEFRHELEANVEPFKGLLLGLFFMAVGMSANLAYFAAHPIPVLGVSLGLMLIKAVLLYGVMRGSGEGNEEAQRIAVLLAQGGEFAFVLFTAAQQTAILTGEASQFLVLVVTISMLLAPLSFVVHERWLRRWLERRKPPEFDLIDGPGNPVIIAGYGRYGQIVSRVLRMAGIPFTALEISYQQVDFVRKFGNMVYYGDASRLELLESARARDARLFVLAIDDVEASVKTAALVRKHFPDLPILARARNRVHYYRLRDLGIDAIERETLLSSLATARQALEQLGMKPEQAARAVSLFEEHDRRQLEAQYAVRQDEAQLIQTAAQAAAQLQELFESDVKESVEK
jgi:monovalent cation:proton antiporter-2 (CPA2) family protein